MTQDQANGATATPITLVMLNADEMMELLFNGFVGTVGAEGFDQYAVIVTNNEDALVADVEAMLRQYVPNIEMFNIDLRGGD